MMTARNIELCLKNKYGIMVGEITLEDLKQKVRKISKEKLKVSGRSLETGRKKTASILLVDLVK